MKLRPRASRPPVPERRKRRKSCAISPHVLWLVLLRLPLKSLFCCKAVCKAFYSVVSDPLFSADYRRSSPRSPSGSPACVGVLVFQQKADKRAKFEDYLIRFIACVGNDIDRIPSEKNLIHPFPCHPTVRRRRFPIPPNYKNNIIASSGGVLLCAGIIYVPEYRCERYSCYVVNPLTREWRVLPPPPILRFLSYPSVVGFVCREGDPSFMGACKYNYEVLHIYKENMSHSHYIQTYSSSSDKWSMVSVPSKISCWSPRSRVMAIGDVFCWISSAGLICYDPATNKFEKSGAPITYGSFQPFCIGDGANGALLLCVSDKYAFEVWVKDDCRQRLQPWRSKRRIEWRDIEMLAQSPSYVVGKDALEPCGWHVRDFQEDPDKVFIERFSEVFSYDLRTEKLEMLHDGQGVDPIYPGTYHPYHLPSWPFKL